MIVFPSNPQPGDIYTDPVSGASWKWDGVKWNRTFNVPPDGGGGGGSTVVTKFNTRFGDVMLNGVDITDAGGALLDSPAFSGTPTAPTAAPGTATLQLASTAFVEAAVAGGFPEAPENHLAYGRMDAAWTRVLAISNDILDGGNF